MQQVGFYMQQSCRSVFHCSRSATVPFCCATTLQVGFICNRASGRYLKGRQVGFSMQHCCRSVLQPVLCCSCNIRPCWSAIPLLQLRCALLGRQVGKSKLFHLVGKSWIAFVFRLYCAIHCELEVQTASENLVISCCIQISNKNFDIFTPFFWTWLNLLFDS